ncbi:hypothetical protein [Chryseobacterium sp. SL1]|uniref:hypothetical protein n=1 Tax=Chryseobacterium sp. SL1 TaxID=2995159 RepID=UPI00227AE738|nr:hypothetical protein [Chryseobacterium sp. SL1]
MNINKYKNMKKTQNIRVTEDLHKNVLEIKKRFQFSTIEDVLSYLISEKETDITEFIKIRETEKTLQKLEKEIYKRVESTHKRLGSYEKLYFKNFSNLNFILSEFGRTLLQAIEEKESTKSTIKNNNKQSIIPENIDKNIQSNYDNLFSENLNNIETIGKLNDKLREIKSLFVLNSNPFSKKYEATISKEIYEQLFLDN